ncbi:hypothetical protein CMUS01_11988 [Colletotrichum musicola]|uniref:Uncharacterized protein n=1 Tax=Colletotrichum musicola TaxID=2175873 RepID=A0A8H6N2M8_9PEZI|nr:hypothetical protein CMUS01_11988 [Colletotrichum musicola]
MHTAQQCPVLCVQAAGGIRTVAHLTRVGWRFVVEARPGQATPHASSVQRGVHYTVPSLAQPSCECEGFNMGKLHAERMCGRPHAASSSESDALVRPLVDVMTLVLMEWESGRDDGIGMAPGKGRRLFLILSGQLGERPITT